MAIPSNWASDPSYEKILIAIFKYYTTSEKTMYMSTHPLVAIYGEEEISFNPRLVGDTVFSIGLVDSSKGVRTTSNFGELKMLNADGKLDNWLEYGVDGRDVTIILLPFDSTNINDDGLIVFSGTLDQWVVPDNKYLSLTFKDPLLLLDYPIQPNNYEVGEVINYTIDAVPKSVIISDNLKDKSKPICYGTVYNIEPVLINGANRVYQVDTEGVDSITDVYDRGVKLTLGTGYKLDNSKGIIELITNNSGTITCDVRGRILPTISTFSDKISDIVIDILLNKSISIGRLSEILQSYISIGVYITERTNTLDILDSIAQSFDGFYGFKPNGKFILSNLTIPNTVVPSLFVAANFGKYGDVFAMEDGTKYILGSDKSNNDFSSLEAIAASAMISIYDDPLYIDTSDILGDISLTNSMNVAFTSKVKYAKNWTVQTDIAYSVEDARKEFLALEYRTALTVNNDIKLKHLRAVESIIEETLLIDESSALQLSNRVLRKNQSPVYELKIKVAANKIVNRTIGSIVHITDYRYGLTTGILSCIRDLAIDFLQGTADVTLLFTKVPNQNGTFSYNLPAEFVSHSGNLLDIVAFFNSGRKYIEMSKDISPFNYNYLYISEFDNVNVSDPVFSIRKIVSGYNMLSMFGEPEIAVSDLYNIGIFIDFASKQIAVYQNNVRLGLFDFPPHYSSKPWLYARTVNYTTGDYTYITNVPGPLNSTPWNILEYKKEFSYL